MRRGIDPSKNYPDWQKWADQFGMLIEAHDKANEYKSSSPPEWDGWEDLIYFGEKNTVEFTSKFLVWHMFQKGITWTHTFLYHHFNPTVFQPETSGKFVAQVINILQHSEEGE